MKRRQAHNTRRAGLSLLEMMVATAIMATLMGSVVVVIRSGNAVWTAEKNDLDVLENGYGVLRHFVQQLRQANSISNISAANETAGSLSFLTSAGATRTWSRNSATSQVSFNNGTGNQLLAKSINQLTFTGYKADGVTTTTTTSEIQVVQCNVQVTLSQGGGLTRNLSCKAWIRSW
jgi:type II secretory pathway pseudopilin PulG